MSKPEAVIVAGGFGTRMLPLTEHRPKHLLEVAGRPLLEHQLGKLAAAGIGHVVVATSYHADLFFPVLGDGSRWGLDIDYLREEEPLGTAGAIRNVAGALRDDPEAAVVIMNGDVLSGHDLAGQLDDFATARSGRPVDVSLHLVEVADPRAFGCVPTAPEGRVTAFLEKTPHPMTNRINAGCYVFRRRVIDTIPAGRMVSVERETFPELLASGALVVGFVDDAPWRDVGTPQALVAASRDLVGPGAIVDPSARVAPDAVVDGGSSVCAHCDVAPGASVRGSVLMAGVRVGVRAVVIDSVVGPGGVVGAGALVAGSTVGDAGVVADGAVADEVVPSGRGRYG